MSDTKAQRLNRPIKDLKGFLRVSLLPDESKSVTFEIKPEDLAYYDVARQAWEIEEIEYLVYAGSSSRRQDLLQDGFMIKNS